MAFNFDDWEVVTTNRSGYGENKNKDFVRITQIKGDNVAFYFYEKVQKVLPIIKGERYRLALKAEDNMVALIKSKYGKKIADNRTSLNIKFKKKCFFGDCVEVPLEDIQTDEDGNIVFYLSGKPAEQKDPKLAKIKAREDATLEIIINILKDHRGGAPETFIKTKTIEALKKRGGEVVGAIYIQELLNGNVGTLFNVAEFGKNNIQ